MNYLSVFFRLLFNSAWLVGRCLRVSGVPFSRAEHCDVTCFAACKAARKNENLSVSTWYTISPSALTADAIAAWRRLLHGAAMRRITCRDVDVAETPLQL